MKYTENNVVTFNYLKYDTIPAYWMKVIKFSTKKNKVCKKYTESHDNLYTKEHWQYKK